MLGKEKNMNSRRKDRFFLYKSWYKWLVLWKKGMTKIPFGIVLLGKKNINIRFSVWDG